MRAWIATLVLFAAGAAQAQEGFPLDGTWRGELAGSGKAHATVVMVLQWDGQKITGTINPGPDAVQISDAKLIPDGWHVTVTAKNAAGKPIAFEGVIGNLGAYDRTITGTWSEGGRSFHVLMKRES
jgi:hypothetical protein